MMLAPGWRSSSRALVSQKIEKMFVSKVWRSCSSLMSARES